jgi:hypothetical protein
MARTVRANPRPAWLALLFDAMARTRRTHMRRILPSAVGALAAAAFCLHHADAAADCNGAPGGVDKLVIIPIKAPDTPSSAILPRSKIISDAKIIRDWFEEVSGGCYVPNVWVDAMQELSEPIGTYCNPNCTQGTIRDAAQTIAEWRYPLYGAQPQTRYIKLVMGMPTPVKDTALTMRPRNFSSGLGLDLALIYHELGHVIFGLWEMLGIRCTDETLPFGATPWSPELDTTACPVHLYGGGERTPMAASRGHYNAVEKYTIGFLDPSHVRFYTRGASDQTKTVRLYTASRTKDASSPQLIRIKLHRNSASVPPFFWIEYRSKLGFDLEEGVDQSVNVYWQDQYYDRAPAFPTPAEFSHQFYFRDVPPSHVDVSRGTPFHDAATGITITRGSYTNEWVDLTIQIPGS